MVSTSPHRRRLSLAATIAAVLVAGVVAVTAPAHAAVPHTPSPATGQRSTPPDDPMATVFRQARDDNAPVTVPRLTDEYSTTAANPDGTLTAVHSSSPQRVKQGDTWVAIDPTLVPAAGGSYTPRAAATDLTIAADHTTRLLSMSDGEHQLAFSWPQALPAPEVSGDTATYREVFKDVDLQITADPSGFSSVFVVKSREAATNPKVQTIDFGLTGTNVQISGTGNGGAEAVDRSTGRQIFHTDTAFMWDSTPSGDALKAAAAGAAKMPDAGSPGGHVAEVKIDVSAGRQRLTLDQDLLTASTTKFPVYVDPYWSGSPGKGQLNWARVSDNGWNVYNSTSKSGATSARIGYDNWPDGAAEKARTYYQMNTSGIRGAHIFSAHLYVVERWAASCANTAAVMYATAAPSKWNSSGLAWGKQPAKRSNLLATVNGRELDCGTSKARVSPASLNFNVGSYIVAAAKSKLSSATFVVQAQSETDRNQWKQLGYGGGATISVKYSYKPQFTNGTGNPRLTPSVVNAGKLLTTTRNPTLTAEGFSPKMNGYQENVRITYNVYNSAGTKILSGNGPATGYNLHGSAWRVNSGLPDGNFTWNASLINASGVGAGVFSKTQAFTVDTVAPKAPTIKSAQFPAGQVGGAFTDRGVFQLTNDRTNNITGYLFTLDGDLSNVVATTGATPWSASTVIQPGIVYLATSDNGNGTAPFVLNGSAGLTFAPGTAGAHRVAAKAVDQATSTSPQTMYSFYAGTSTPAFATGDKLISGWTATNNDGTTTTVPAATTTSRTGRLVAQTNSPGYYFVSGTQAWLSNISTTSKVAVGDRATFNVNLPAAGPWEIGASLTTGVDYGTYTLTLDKGSTGEKVLITGLDAYSSRTSTQYVNFGVIKDSGGNPRILAQGLHSITLDVTGKNTASTGYMAGVDAFRLAPIPTCAINNTAGCLNNTAVSTYTAGTTPVVTPADATGSGTSFEAADLRAAGWTPGSTVAVNGAAVKLPTAFGTGVPDNMLSSGQIVTVPGSGAVNKGNAVVFTGFASGQVSGVTGTITYAGDGCAAGASQSYRLDTIADWAATPRGEAVLAFARRNKSNATQENVPVSIFAISVPLQCPGVPVTSISLPLVTATVTAGAPSLHFFGLGIRPTSATTGSTATGWVGSWAAAQDTATVKATTATGTTDATLTNQTVRIPVQLSIGTAAGHQMRVRLANSLGRSPITLDAASIALQDTTSGGATAAATPTPVTFGGSRAVTLPAGGDILSDPVTLAAPDRAVALVSVKVDGTLTAVPGHSDARVRLFQSTTDDVDHTGERGSTSFSSSTVTGVPFVSGIDVTTPAAYPAGALVLFGDQTINSDTAYPDGLRQTTSRLADALAGAPETGNTVPFGVLNLGSAGWGNKATLPVNNTALPETATAAVDRAILNQSNVRAVLISAGTSDLLACTATTAEGCAAPVRTKLVALAFQLHRFKTDDADNPSVPQLTDTGVLKVYVATLPPFPAGTTTVRETARQLVNAYILGGDDDAAALQGYADGVINFAAAVSTDSDHLSATTLDDYLYDTGTSKQPNDLYFESLAGQYLADADATDWVTNDQSGGTEPDADPVAAWKFGEGTGTTARDTGYGTGSARTLHNATLHQAGWGSGRIIGRKAATFNGTSSYADTDLKIDTVQSFTVSAWVRLADKSADSTVFAREADGYASLYLRYQKATDRWVAQMPSAAAGDTVTFRDATASAPAQTGIWTHLAATYDANVETLTLAINGVADTAIDEINAFNDPNGPTWIGRSDGTWFAGDIADLKVWARPINDAELAAEATATAVTDWKFEDDSDLTIARDSTPEKHDGTLVGAAAYTYPGHADGDIGALRLNGVNAAVNAAGPLLRTDQSFTVAAWVRLTRTDGTFTAVSQDGANVGRFMLQWSQQCTCWRFRSSDTDQASTTTSQANAPAAAAPTSWTHVAAVHDAAAGTLTIYVNGAPAGSTTYTAAPWNATGIFTAGHSRAGTDWFPGDIDAVRAFQGALEPDAIKELSAS